MKIKFVILLISAFLSHLNAQDENPEIKALKNNSISENQTLILEFGGGITLLGGGIESSLLYRFPSSMVLRAQGGLYASGFSFFGMGSVVSTQQLAVFGGKHVKLKGTKRLILEVGLAASKIETTTSVLLFINDTHHQNKLSVPVKIGMAWEHKYTRFSIVGTFIGSEAGMPLYLMANLGIFLF